MGKLFFSPAPWQLSASVQITFKSAVASEKIQLWATVVSDCQNVDACLQKSGFWTYKFLSVCTYEERQKYCNTMECSVGEWGMVLKTYTSKRLKRGYFETGEQAGFAAARFTLDQSPSPKFPLLPPLKTLSMYPFSLSFVFFVLSSHIQTFGLSRFWLVSYFVRIFPTEGRQVGGPLDF